VEMRHAWENKLVMMMLGRDIVKNGPNLSISCRMICILKIVEEAKQNLFLS